MMLVDCCGTGYFSKAFNVFCREEIILWEAVRALMDVKNARAQDPQYLAVITNPQSVGESSLRNSKVQTTIIKMARNQQQEDDWASYMGKKTYGFEASNLNRQKMTEVGDFQVASIPDSIERMLPAVVVNDPETGWMQEDEAEIQASWDASSIRREMDSLVCLHLVLYHIYDCH